MASRQELLLLLRLGKKMDKDIAYKIYGYAATRPEFEEEALSLMERIFILYADPGDRNPRELYRQIVDEYLQRQKKEMKPVVHWFAGECEKQWKKRQKEGDENGRKRRNYRFTGLPQDW